MLHKKGGYIEKDKIVHIYTYELVKNDEINIAI